MTKTKQPFDKVRAAVDSDPRRRARVQELKHAYPAGEALAALRVKLDASQTQVASALGVSQANVSRIENSEDVYLSTLSGYVAALGGHIRVQAIFGEQAIDVFKPPANPIRRRRAPSQVSMAKPKAPVRQRG